MTEQRRALALHLTGGRQPLFIAIAPDAVDAVVAGLPELMRKGDVETITAANGWSIAVNFAHVQAAHIDTVPGAILGSPAREF
jgi:hypothetical protein